MADILSTAVSALQTYRRGLDTTSHNIANVDTEGYSRQRIQTQTREAQPYGNGWVGSGVNVTTIQRVFDEYVALQFRSTSSSFAQQETFAALAERVNNLYADSSTGLSATLQKFVNSLQGVASAPSSMSARQVMISEAGALASQMNDYAMRLDQLADELNQRVTSATQDVNSLAGALADLNARIVIAQQKTGQPPNDLLDQRDKLIDELSSKVAVNTVRQDDGSLNVFVGTGQPLVLGTMASRLVTQPDAFDASRIQVSLETPSGPVDVTRNLTGGELGGLLDFRSQMLDAARNSLGQLAVGIATVVNDQQLDGMDLNGRMGTPLFEVGDVQVLPSALNTGAGDVTVTRTDATQLTTANYRLELAGGTWSLRRADTGATVTMTGSGTAADPFAADGLEIVVPAGAANGDQFLLRPTQGAALGMDLRFTDPARLAAATPVIAGTSATNVGTGKPGALTVIDASDPNLRTGVTIRFTSSTTYTLDGGATTRTFTPGQPIDHHGWRLQLGGTPASGDTFTVGNNATGVGDNRNFLALSSALSKPYLDGGTTSINGTIARVVADVGVRTRQSQVARDALEVVHNDAIATRHSVSGVNLDEEAANLVKFQQAYQAAAQIVQIANATFDALLGAIRR